MAVTIDREYIQWRLCEVEVHYGIGNPLEGRDGNGMNALFAGWTDVPGIFLQTTDSFELNTSGVGARYIRFYHGFYQWLM